MLYQLRERNQAWVEPLSLWAKTMAQTLDDDAGIWSRMPGSQGMSAGLHLLHRMSREYEKPAFGIHTVESRGRQVAVAEQVVLQRPFCKLLHFKRSSDNPEVARALKADPPVLICAPLAGHYATLVRDTVRTMLAEHDVYVTDWADARLVHPDEGLFSLDDYVEYIQGFLRHIGSGQVHVMAVCQSTVPALAAISLMASRGENTPKTLTLMGGPVDARKSPTMVNDLAMSRSYAWFENNMIYTVPAGYAGAGRKVYPGFIQHFGFVLMNPERHAHSYWDYFNNMAAGDHEGAAAHTEFYDEYNAVLDLDARYYLDTISTVFQEYKLARGTWDVQGTRVRPQDIAGTSLLTVEGELDDITGLGQTRAAHALCSGIPDARKHHLEAAGSGHYGIFSGSRWRKNVYPTLRGFIRSVGQ